MAGATAIAAAGLGVSDCVKTPPPTPEDAGIAPVASSSASQGPQALGPDSVSVVYGPPPRPDASSSSDTASRGQLLQGVVAVSGGPVNNAERRLAGLRPSLRRCYFDALTRAEGTGGEVVFTLEIGVDGKVSTVKSNPQAGHRIDATMLRCLENRLRVTQFEMGESATVATLTFRAVFELSPPAPR